MLVWKVLHDIAVVFYPVLHDANSNVFLLLLKLCVKPLYFQHRLLLVKADYTTDNVRAASITVDFFKLRHDSLVGENTTSLATYVHATTPDSGCPQVRFLREEEVGVASPEVDSSVAAAALVSVTPSFGTATFPRAEAKVRYRFLGCLGSRGFT